MNSRLLLPAWLSLAALNLLAQDAPPPGTLPVTKAPKGALPAGMMDLPDTPALTGPQVMKAIEDLHKLGPLIFKPRVQPNKDQGNGTTGATEITSAKGDFNQKAQIGIFTGNVYVENPEFTVTCDKLTAYMHHDERDPAAPSGPGAKPAVKSATPKPATPKPTPAPATPTSSKAPRASVGTSGNATQDERVAALGETPPPPQQGGLEKAIAEGHVVINQDKMALDGTLTQNVGHCQKAVYETATGNIYMYGWPTVDQGVNTSTATAAETFMILNRAGTMETRGPAKVIIRNGGGPAGDAH